MDIHQSCVLTHGGGMEIVIAVTGHNYNHVDDYLCFLSVRQHSMYMWYLCYVSYAPTDQLPLYLTVVILHFENN